MLYDVIGASIQMYRTCHSLIVQATVLNQIKHKGFSYISTWVFSVNLTSMFDLLNKMEVHSSFSRNIWPFQSLIDGYKV